MDDEIQLCFSLSNSVPNAAETRPAGYLSSRHISHIKSLKYHRYRRPAFDFVPKTSAVMKTKGNEARLASKRKKEQTQSFAESSQPGPSTGWRDPQGTIYFWREFERHYGFLCQWAPSPFEVDGKLYYTAEHWMMAGKARLFRDQPMMVKILQSTHPGKAKALGKQVRGFTDKIWLQHCDEVVEEGNMHKFGSNEGLRRKLLATGNRELVEASPRDRVWGVGFDAAHAEANRSQWGQNRLGLVLMRVRERLREEDRKKELGIIEEVVEDKAEESQAGTAQSNES